MNKEYISIGQAANALGVSRTTLRRWDASGRLVAERTPSGQRRYKLSAISSFNPLHDGGTASSLPTIAYAKVSSHDQREDLDRQVKALEMYCASHGLEYRVIRDLGSSMNYRKKGLRELIELISNREIGRLVVMHKDRLLRFGTELVFAMCEMSNVEVVIVNQDNERSFEEELANDVLMIIMVLSAHMYGVRSHKYKRLVEGMRKAVDDAENAQDTPVSE